MKNKTLATLLTISIVAAFVAMFIESTSHELSEALYGLSGLGMLVFGSMAAYRLNKLD